MPKKKKEENLNLTRVSVTSRRSGKLGLNDFFTFECMLESNIDGLAQSDIDERIAQLWQKANSEVDNQFAETIDDLKKDE